MNRTRKYNETEDQDWDVRRGERGKNKRKDITGENEIGKRDAKNKKEEDESKVTGMGERRLKGRLK